MSWLTGYIWQVRQQGAQPLSLIIRTTDKMSKTSILVMEERELNPSWGLGQDGTKKAWKAILSLNVEFFCNAFILFCK